jgi:hypothetical protein
MARPNKHHQPAITRVVIDNAQIVAFVESTRSKPKEHLALAVINKDQTDYVIRLTNFKNKATALAVNQSDLFAQSSASHQIPRDDVTLIKRKSKPAANWGNGVGQFPYTTYEFTIELWDSANTTKLDDLDPDFEITP